VFPPILGEGLGVPEGVEEDRMERIPPRGRERERDLLLVSTVESGGDRSEEFRGRLVVVLSLGGELGVVVGRESKWVVGVRGGGGGAGEEDRERGLKEGRAKGVLKTILEGGVEEGWF